MSEQGTNDAAEFLTPPTGDASSDARMASEVAPPAKEPTEPDPPPADNEEAALVGVAEPQECEEDAQPEGDAEETGDKKDGADEFEEIEYGGKKHRLPKELKPLLMMQQDYTRKTQEVAEQRKALEGQYAQAQARIQASIQQADLHRHVIADVAELANLDKAISQYANVDWSRLDQEDPIKAGQLYRQLNMLKDQRQGVAQKIGQAEANIQQERRQQAEAQQREAREAHAKRQAEVATEFQGKYKLPNETVKKVFDYGREQGGYSDAELQNLADVRPLTTLYKSYLWDQHVAAQRAAAKAKAPAPEIVKPLAPTPKGSTAPASRGLDDRLSAEEWVRRRNEQVRGRSR